MRPLAAGLIALALFSVLFEPVRMALWGLGDAVGGVGGVGGLTSAIECMLDACVSEGRDAQAVEKRGFTRIYDSGKNSFSFLI